MNDLNPNQQRVLAYIRDRFHTTGMSPSVREIGDTIGLRSSCSVQRIIEALEERGYVERVRNRWRGIRPVESGSALLTYHEQSVEMARLRETIERLRRENEALRAEIRGMGGAA